MFSKLQTCSSSPCNSSIFCSSLKTRSFGARVLRPSKVSAFLTFSFQIPLKLSIFAFHLPFVLLGGGRGGGPLDLVWYANEVSMISPT